MNLYVDGFQTLTEALTYTLGLENRLCMHLQQTLQPAHVHIETIFFLLSKCFPILANGNTPFLAPHSQICTAMLDSPFSHASQAEV